MTSAMQEQVEAIAAAAGECQDSVVLVDLQHLDDNQQQPHVPPGCILSRHDLADAELLLALLLSRNIRMHDTRDKEWLSYATEASLGGHKQRSKGEG